jgi:hypothetical protein
VHAVLHHRGDDRRGLGGRERRPRSRLGRHHVGDPVAGGAGAHGVHQRLVLVGVGGRAREHDLVGAHEERELARFGVVERHRRDAGDGGHQVLHPGRFAGDDTGDRDAAAVDRDAVLGVAGFVDGPSDPVGQVLLDAVALDHRAGRRQESGHEDGAEQPEPSRSGIQHRALVPDGGVRLRTASAENAGYGPDFTRQGDGNQPG